MRLYLYVIEHDKGFAPNPFFGACTLAACKPQIRDSAVVGDFIAGFGSKPSGLSGRVTYWMRVEEILTFDAYWTDPRFRLKRPQMGGSLMQCYGDNIYHRDEASGAWIQDKSFHSDPPNPKNSGNLARDTGRTEKVLIGREFAYWGGAGPAAPSKFGHMIPSGRPYRCRFMDEDRDAFVAWLLGRPERGFRSEPADWPDLSRAADQTRKAA
jgi:hypothetical protein